MGGLFSSSSSRSSSIMTRPSKFENEVQEIENRALNVSNHIMTKPKRPWSDVMDGSFPCSSSKKTRASKFENEVLQLNESLFELYRPADKPSLQVLFFHGFQPGDYGDAHLSTWESGDGSVLWPKAWLSQKFPNAHILSIAYNCHLTQSSEHGNMDLFVITENIMADLLEAKIGQYHRCPLVLVGHSFGGLVIKDLCLHASKQATVAHKKFLENVTGIFFYSTPHKGIDLEKCAPLFNSNSPLLEHVRPLSTPASRLNHDFENLHKSHKHWQIAGVGEMCSTKWGESLAFTVVEEASSRYGDDFVIVPDSDHITIARPKEIISRSFKALITLIDKVGNQAKAYAIHNVQGLPYFPSGLEKRVKDVQNLLKVDASKATVVGIVGMGGIGKTTIAKQLFNQISLEFEYTCFVDNVKGIPTYNLEDWLLNNFHRNGSRVNQRIPWSDLKGKKTLIILDDIDKECHLASLPKLQDFGGESHIIITSRDHDVISIFTDCDVYDVDFLNKGEAKELLCQHVFSLDNIPNFLLQSDDRLRECVDAMVLKCQGLPLTLEVMGRYLRPHKKEIGVWNEVIQKLGEAKSMDGKKDDRVWASLKVSYDNLENEEQQMFIDAGTCFFQQPLGEALAAWSTSYHFAKTAWENLIRRSLVKAVAKGRYDENIKIWVHEHLRDLAKKVSQRHEVSIDYEDTYTIEKSNSCHLILVREERLTRRQWRVSLWYEKTATKMEDTKSLESSGHMENLKYLYIEHSNDEGWRRNFLKNIPQTVSLLKWNRKGSFREGKRSFYEEEEYLELPLIDWKGMNKLGLLELSGWKISKEFLAELGDLKALRILDLYDVHLDSLPEEISNLTHSRQLRFKSFHLSKLPDSFGKLGALEYLVFINLRISELPQSFGHLRSLVDLHISSCNSLRRLPESFGGLCSLVKLHISSCHSLRSLPDSFGGLSSLVELGICNCASLTSLPESFGSLCSLVRLYIVGCRSLTSLPESFGSLLSLVQLRIAGCHSLRSLPESFGGLSSLVELVILSCDSLTSLPESFGSLCSLVKIRFSGCESLRMLPESFGQLPCFGNLSSQQDFVLHGCPSLQELPASLGALSSSLEELNIENCGLERLPDNFGQLKALKKLIIVFNRNLKALPSSFGNLSSLQVFSLRGSPSLQELPASFGALSSLEQLTLESCGLERLPDNLRKLTALKRLSLDIREPDDLVQFCDNIGLWSALEVLELTLDGSKFKRLPHNFGVLTMLTELTISNADCLVELPDDIGRISSLRLLRLIMCKKLKSLPQSLGNPVSPQLVLPRGDRVSPSATTSESSKASNTKALPRVLHKDVRCDGCDMIPFEGTRFTKKYDYDLCSSCFEKADDQADYVRIIPNSRRLQIDHCPFLEELGLASLGWVKRIGSSGEYVKVA